jgi:hypothetical protein
MLFPDRVQRIFAFERDRVVGARYRQQLRTQSANVRKLLAPAQDSRSQSRLPAWLFTDVYADYCHQRFTEHPHLRPSSLNTCANPRPRRSHPCLRRSTGCNRLQQQVCHLTNLRPGGMVNSEAIISPQGRFLYQISHPGRRGNHGDPSSWCRQHF